MSPRTTITVIALAVGALAVRPIPADPTGAELERSFTQTVRPFLDTYCVSCHSGEKPMAQLDLKRFANLQAVAGDYAHWALVKEKLHAAQMPPAPMKQPPAE